MGLLLYSIRSVMARRLTSFAAIVGIAALVFTLAGAMMLLGGVRKSLDEKGDPNVAVILSTGSNSEIESNLDAQQTKSLVDESGVQDPSARVTELVTVASLPRPNGQSTTTLVRGIAEGGERFRRGFKLVDGRMINPGTPEVIVGVKLRGKLANIQIGDDIEFEKNRRAKIVGYFSDGDSFHESEVWCDQSFLQSAYGRQGFFSVVRIRMPSPDALDALRQRLEHDKRFALRIYSEPAYLEKQGAIAAGMITVFGTSMSFFIGLGASLGVAMTMFGTVAQRRREIGVLRALGFARTKILVAFLFEAISFGIIASVLGSLAAATLRLFEFSMVGGGSAEITFRFDTSPTPMFVASLAALAICTVSGFIPAFNASRVSPTAALRG